MAGRNVGRTGVDEFAVDLVRKEEQVVFLHHVADAVHLAAGVEVTRGVVGVADQDAARAVVDQLLELLDRGQRESVLDGGHHRADHGARRNGEGHVVGVGRFGNDDFVARVEARHEGEEHGLGAARGDDDLLGRELDLILLVIGHQLFAQRAVAVAGAVFQHLAVDVFEGFETLLGRGEVGLADVQMVDFRSPGAGRVGQRDEFAYRGGRHLLGAE